MQYIIDQIKDTREQIKFIEDIFKKCGKSKEAQIFINYRIGYDNEDYKHLEINDVDVYNEKTTKNNAYKILQLILDSLKGKEDSWIRLLKEDMNNARKVLEQDTMSLYIIEVKCTSSGKVYIATVSAKSVDNALNVIRESFQEDTAIIPLTQRKIGISNGGTEKIVHSYIKAY